MRREDFLNSLNPLSEYIKAGGPELDEVLAKAHQENQWFIPKFSKNAMVAIANEFLDKEKCNQWMQEYVIRYDSPRDIGIIMAGNVPLVGFHDLLSVLASGHKAIIKLSDKDSVLSKYVTDKWIEFLPELAERIHYTEKLVDYDAVIATGSNNSSRYFEYYFRNHPHILRKNRNGVAVLNGNESEDQLKELGKDIFSYFGLGCRNVSKVFVPEGYDFSNWETIFSEWEFVSEHNKFRNNLDYNYAIYIINQIPHIQLGYLILKEDDAIASRIGSLNYSFYNDRESLSDLLNTRKEDIQCIVSVDPFPDWDHVLPGQSQYPYLSQYADGVDTMKFLTGLYS